MLLLLQILAVHWVFSMFLCLLEEAVKHSHCCYQKVCCNHSIGQDCNWVIMPNYFHIVCNCNCFLGKLDTLHLSEKSKSPTLSHLHSLTAVPRCLISQEMYLNWFWNVSKVCKENNVNFIPSFRIPSFHSAFYRCPLIGHSGIYQPKADVAPWYLVTYGHICVYSIYNMRGRVLHTFMSFVGSPKRRTFAYLNKGAWIAGITPSLHSSTITQAGIDIFPVLLDYFILCAASEF